MRVSKVTLTVDLSATGNSLPVEIMFLNGYSIVASWTGTPTGTLTLEGSNNAWNEDALIPSQANASTSATWVAINGSSTSLTGAAGSYMWNASDQNFQAVRVKYTRTNGTGTLTGYFRGKSGT